jgi:hypothetical protein
MHEFEDLVEETIRLLNASEQAGKLDLRTMFWRLYQFQAAWDTGFTHFRVMDILLQRRFVYRFELNQHPDYALYREYFDGLSDFTHIYLKPGQPWNSQENPAVGYYNPPYLYCDAGSPLWRHFVENSVLTGADAVPPDEKVTLVEVAREAVVEAYRKADFSLVGWWYSLLIVHIFSFNADEELDRLKDDPAMGEIVATCYQANRRREEQQNPPLQANLAGIGPLPKNLAGFPDLLRLLREENRAGDNPETVAYYEEQRRRYVLTPGEEYPAG